MIGTGYFSNMHCSILAKMPGVKIKAILGTSKEKANQFASQFDSAKGYDSLTQMLDMNTLDAVYISVPPMSHGEIELELIKRGIPFFIEKPLSNDIATPTKILNELKNKPLLTSVGYHFRYKESIQKLKSLLLEQQQGMVVGEWSGDMPMVSWWRDQNKSGGQFIEQTTHLVDLLRYLGGEIDEVFCYVSNQVMHRKADNVSVSDVGTVNMRLTSGAVANLSNTCILPPGINKVGLSFYTDQGLLSWSQEKLHVRTTSATYDVIDKSNPYNIENKAFIKALKTGDTSGILSDYEDAYQTLLVKVAALESAEKGVPVLLETLKRN
ncbi:Gfo/Idh/MocA family protein [Fredinandcohnia sp. 179-A 10B2 NHS]|uniref:Gfo/Idh/MocA family protein n=1 Tax=Fredinandcohnia sp. 179-A 10B2 NHS TaxID=3235176 RepID=UPI0039A1AC95